MKYGIDEQLEEMAWALIKPTLTLSHHEKSDLLTPWKEVDRNRRRVLVQGGHWGERDSPSVMQQDRGPEAHVRKGMVTRAYNKARPDLNSVDHVVCQPHRVARSSWDCGYTFPDRIPGMTITLGEWRQMQDG